MVQPTLNIAINFDATKDYTFTFMYLGAERSTINMLSIRKDEANSKPVYEEEIYTADKIHKLEGGILQNGNSYYAKLKVKIGDSWSDWSPEISFMCLDTPVVKFDTIDSKNFIYNDDVLMSALYMQAQGEPVINYQYVLYDQNHSTIENYPVRVPVAASPTRFSERVQGLVKGKLYYIALTVVTKHDISYTAEHQFVPQYIVPTISGIIQPLVMKDDGQVIIEAFLKQMLATPAKPFVPNRPTDSPTYYTYWKDDYVIIPDDNPLMFTKLGMAKASDFIVKVWCMSVKNGVFLDFAPELGKGIHMKFIKYDDFIVCEKEFAGLKSRTKSNVISGLGLKEFYLYIKVKEFRIQMEINPIG